MAAAMSVNIGVLSLHGDVIEHVNSIKTATKKLQANKLLADNVTVIVKEIRKPEEVSNELDGLILPGGESTVLTNHLTKNGFLDKIKSWTVNKNKFTFGTCAGLIMLSNTVSGGGKDSVAAIGGLDITCVRNAFGRQINSFEGKLELTDDNLAQKDPGIVGVFIRAPGIKSINSEAVAILCKFPEGVSSCGTGDTLSSAVGVRQDNVMACSFHPELTPDTRWHEYFVKEVVQRKINAV